MVLDQQRDSAHRLRQRLCGRVQDRGVVVPGTERVRGSFGLQGRNWNTISCSVPPAFCPRAALTPSCKLARQGSLHFGQRRVRERAAQSKTGHKVIVVNAVKAHAYDLRHHGLELLAVAADFKITKN